MSQLRTEKFPRGSLIFKEGDKPRVPCMYDVLCGSIGIYLNYGAPEQKQLTTIEAAGFFGEMNLLEGLPRSATAVALEDCELRIVTEKELWPYFQERPTAAKQLLQQMSGRLRGLTEQYMEVCRTIAEREPYGARQPDDEELNQKIEEYTRLWNAYRAETQQADWDNTWGRLLH